MNPNNPHHVVDQVQARQTPTKPPGCPDIMFNRDMIPWNFGLCRNNQGATTAYYVMTNADDVAQVTAMSLKIFGTTSSISITEQNRQVIEAQKHLRNVSIAFVESKVVQKTSSAGIKVHGQPIASIKMIFDFARPMYSLETDKERLSIVDKLRPHTTGFLDASKTAMQHEFTEFIGTRYHVTFEDVSRVMNFNGRLKRNSELFTCVFLRNGINSFKDKFRSAMRTAMKQSKKAGKIPNNDDMRSFCTKVT